MTSTTVNNGSTSPPQSGQPSSPETKSESQFGVNSLASAKDPTEFSFNQKQSTVGTFSQKTGENPQTPNAVPSFSNLSIQSPAQSNSFPQSSAGNVPRFSFNNQTGGNPPRFSFNNATGGDQPRFSFNNATGGDQPRFSFNNATGGDQPRFSFNNAAGGNPPPFSFNNAAGGNPPPFSFNNAAGGNPPSSSHNTPTVNNQPHHSSIQQLSGDVSTVKAPQAPSNSQTQPASPISTQNNETTKPKPVSASFNSPEQASTGNSTSSNTPDPSRKLSNPTTPISQQPSPLSQTQDEQESPTSSADNSLIAKKVHTKLRDQSALVVDRSDPTSPLYSLKEFKDLNLKTELLNGIYNMGFKIPSKIQEITLPQLLSDPPKNIIAQSQSGTGKTAAFSLTILSRIDPSIQTAQALILAPTFELAIQIGSVIEKMAQFLPYIKVAYAVRDPNISKRSTRNRGQLISEQIVIGTPGTVEDWWKRNILDLNQFKMCCVDEADVMIATEGFARVCVDLAQRVKRSSCQMMLFSATYSDEVMTFARQIVENPIVLRLRREKQVLNNIRQYFIRCFDLQSKYTAIEQIYIHLTVGQAMIFCRTKATARELAVRMANQNHSVRELTSALDIEQRASIIRQFREGVFRVLISTNVTSRGIDIDDVSLVINYDMPTTPDQQPDCETYLHRIGRCGRFGKLGYTFNLIGSEKDFEVLRSIEEYFSHPAEEITIERISHLEQDPE